MRHFTSYRWAGAVVTALALFATAIAGQPPRPAPADPLDAARAQQRIAEQKAESDIIQTIDNADRLARFNHKEKAVQGLKTAKANLQGALGISEAARTRFTQMLDAKLAAVEGRAFVNPNPGPGAKLDPKAAEVKAANEAALAKYFAELKDVRDGLKLVEQAQNDKDAARANAEIARLAKAYPYNPSVIALGQTDSTRNRLSDAQAYYAESAKRWVAVQKGINESALPAIRDVEFPANWKELSARRLKTVEISAKERKIIEALDKPVTIAFAERPLEEALQDLSNALDQPLLIDKKSLEDLGLDLKKGVSLQGKGLSGRTVLRSVLATQGLTFVVKDELIQIVTVERSKSLLSTRVYYLGDLVQGVGQFSGIQWGPFVNAQQTAANADAIIDAIKKIDPLSWNGNGGPGTVTYHAASQSIIVRNSAEVHFSLGKTFGPGK